jgi:hypothetical protein
MGRVSAPQVLLAGDVTEAAVAVPLVQAGELGVVLDAEVAGDHVVERRAIA